MQKNKNRWVVFALIAFFAALLVFASLASLNVASKRNQVQAVAIIEELGGSVRYDYEKEDPKVPNLFKRDAVPKAPNWLRKRLGDEYFGHVVSVDLSDTSVTDDDLKALRGFPHLEILNLANTSITGNGLAHLQKLTDLKVLSLWNTSVDDAGLSHIEKLTKLWQLVLDGTNISDAGLVHLEKLTNLEEWLGLTHTDITDDGLHHLEGLAKLRSLNLRMTKVTDSGAAKLKRVLSNTEISHGS